ncbi:MAG: VWA domain-containing protein [Candidatus Dormibacteria bacterium]
MTVLAPLAGFLGLGLPAIVAMYFLKVRRREVAVPSTALWRRLLLDRQANAPWQRLRFSWLLLLQLLALLALVLAAVRPALLLPTGLAGNTVILLDRSASMQATDARPSRFEAARAEARALVNQLGAHDRMSIVGLDDHPEVLAAATGDRAALLAALDRVHPSNGPADLQQAVALASSLAGSASDSHLVVLSDGVTEPLREPILLPFKVDYRQLGVSGENVAITALVVRPGGRRVAFVHVQNFGRGNRHVDLEWRVDGRVADLRAVELAAAAGQDLEFALPAGAERVTASIGHEDLLALDDTAFGVATLPRTSEVLLVSPGNLFLERALALRSDLRVRLLAPKDYHPGIAADLVIFDGMVPPVLPAVPYWLLNPPVTAALGVADFTTPGRVRASNPGDPLLADLDLRGVHVARARDLRTSSFGTPLLEGDAGPLMLQRQAPVRALLSSFDLHESDLPLRPAFPILVDHLAAWLLPQSVAPRAYHPGEAVLLAASPGATALKVVAPDGNLTVIPVRGGAPGVFARTDQPGFYTVETVGVVAPPSAFAVNAADSAGGTSDIAPHPRLDLGGSSSAVRPAARTEAREWWPWLVLVALLLLTGEWVVFHRGV